MLLLTGRFVFACCLAGWFLGLTAGAVRGEAFAVADAPDLAEGANLRVMSYNILSEEWNDKTPVEGRKESVAATILYFAPDVVGLQEVSANWYAVLPDLIAEQYEMVHPNNSRGETNYTGMAYNRQKVKLLDSGTEYYSVGSGGSKIRLVTWGHYQKLDTDARFVVMNTHWCIRQENRLVHAREMADLFATLREKFNAPIVGIGDFNADQRSEEYQNFARQTEMKNARVDAATVNRAFRTAHALGKKPRPIPEHAIDQIFYTPDLQCLFYNVLVDQVILDASDHCPIYADFKLN